MLFFRIIAEKGDHLFGSLGLGSVRTKGLGLRGEAPAESANTTCLPNRLDALSREVDKAPTPLEAGTDNRKADTAASSAKRARIAESEGHSSVSEDGAGSTNEGDKGEDKLPSPAQTPTHTASPVPRDVVL